MRSSDPIFSALIKSYGQSETLTIPRALVSLVGDIKTALLLSQIIFWSSKKVDEDGWFYKSFRQWEEETSLSKNEVGRSSKVLEDMGLVSTSTIQVNGAPVLHYRFMSENYYVLISGNQKSISENQKSDFLKPEIGFLENRNPSLLYTEDHTEENKTEINVEDGDLYISDPIEDFLKNSYTRRRRVRFKVPKSEGQILITASELESSMGVREFRSAFLNFLDDGSDWLVKSKWPIRVFMSNTCKWEHKRPTVKPADPQERLESPERHHTGTPVPAIDPTAPQGQKPVPEEIDLWNTIVTSGNRVDHFSWDMQEGVQLARCRVNGNWTMERWKKVCEKTQFILSGGITRYNRHLQNFYWFIKADSNWWNVFCGKLDHLKEVAEGGKPKMDLQAVIAKMRRETEEEKLREAGTKGTN